MQLIIEIPDAVSQRVIDAICAQHGYKGAPTAPARAAFARQTVREFIHQTVKAWEAGLAAEVARKAAITKADSEIVLS